MDEEADATYERLLRAAEAEGATAGEAALDRAVEGLRDAVTALQAAMRQIEAERDPIKLRVIR